MRRLYLLLLLVALGGCHRTPRERKVDYMERIPIAQEVRVEGHLSARCRIADRPQAGATVRLFDTGAESEIARTVTGADGDFFLAAPRRIDGTYALRLDDYREPLPDGPVLSYHVALTVPCEDDDPVGLLASFRAHDGRDDRGLDPNAGVRGPDGQGRAPQTIHERWQVQKPGGR